MLDTQLTKLLQRMKTGTERQPHRINRLFKNPLYVRELKSLRVRWNTLSIPILLITGFRWTIVMFTITFDS